MCHSYILFIIMPGTGMEYVIRHRGAVRYLTLPSSKGIMLVSIGLVMATTHRSGFPPGFNGLAKSPPLGWRSWNCYGSRVSQSDISATIDAITSKVWTINGKANMSLLDAGYSSVGIDEGWEACGKGVNGTQHDAKGNPVVNAKFPDMAALVKYGHDAGLKMGWYENGCACGERKALMANYEGDVRMLHSLGFDGVKLDGCGAQVKLQHAPFSRSTAHTSCLCLGRTAN